MATNPLKKLTDALTGVPDVPTAESKAVLARQLTIDAAAAVESARAALAAADEAQDPAGVLKAEAALIAANRDADRATRALQIAEDKLQRAKDAAEAAEQVAHRKSLANLITARDSAGRQIEAALVALEHGVKALADIDEGVAGISTDVLGRDYVQGHNGGKAALDRQIAVELQQRGIQGRPSSVALPSFSDWMSTGTELLKARV